MGCFIKLPDWLGYHATHPTQSSSFQSQLDNYLNWVTKSAYNPVAWLS